MEHVTIVNKGYKEIRAIEGTDNDNDSDDTSVSNTSTYCSICLETEQSNNRYIKFYCDHTFHVDCFETYFDFKISHKPNIENISCPICRKDISTNTLKNVFNVSQENHNQNITLLVQTDISEDDNTRRLQTELIAIFVFVFFIFLILFLAFIDNT
jgi:hypothetical protein